MTIQTSIIDNNYSYNLINKTINLINNLCQFRLIAYTDFTQSYHLMFETFLFSFAHTLMPLIDIVCSTYTYISMIQSIINSTACSCLIISSKIESEYDQEVPQSQTADNPVAPRGRVAQTSRDTKKTN